MKRAVVTGSTKGIGKAVGMRFLKEGYHVTFNYAKDDNGRNRLEKEIMTDFSEAQVRGRYEIIKNDFSDEQHIDSFVEQIVSGGRYVDALVLNAGITDRTGWDEMQMSQWDEVLYTNLTVPAFIIQKIGRTMQSGSILCIGSIMGRMAHSLSVPYGISKAGIHFLAQSLVKEYCSRGITVNALMAGFTDTDWQRNKPEEIRNRIASKIALKRFAAPDEIADLAYELLTNRYITGSVVKIDGGYCYM